MSTDYWTVTPHVIPACHIRGHPRGIRDVQNPHLCLSVNQYIPKSLPEPNKPGITLLVAHGIGSPKEVYEPLLDELLLRGGVPIRSAWSIDAANHAQSYFLNEPIIGDEPHWLDPAHDFLHVINTFQTEFPPPIYAIGQSWGCINVLMMSIFHSTIFAGLILLEPTFETGYRFQSLNQSTPIRDSQSRFALLAKRRDVWPSRSTAESALRKSPYFAPYDPRVFSRLIKHGLRPAPSPANPEAVTLTTPKPQEVYLFGRPDPSFPGYDAAPGYATRKPDTKLVEGFYRGEVTQIKRALRDLNPPVLYVWGTQSDIGNSTYPQRVIDQTGIGDLGGGGAKAGQVGSIHVEGADHLMPYKMPGKVAEAIAPWVKAHAAMWHERTNRRKQEQPPFEPGILNPLWAERIAKL